MSISVNGQSLVPPGFRFHPTEEELLQYYLRKKVLREKIDLDVIRELDLNKLEPWEMQELCKIGSTPQNEWYLFSHKDKKYPAGRRTNRATAAGFWKATGRDKPIYSNSERIGMRKTLVFYTGRAPRGQKSDWIMHEYRLGDRDATTEVSNVVGEAAREEGWVVCRVFKQKSHRKALDGGVTSSITSEKRSQILDSTNDDDGSLEQIIKHARQFNNRNADGPIDACNLDYFFQSLQRLEKPNSDSSGNCQPNKQETITGIKPGNNWDDIDLAEASKSLMTCFNEPQVVCYQDPELQLPSLLQASSSYKYGALEDNKEVEIDPWIFPMSSTSPSSSKANCRFFKTPMYQNNK